MKFNYNVNQFIPVSAWCAVLKKEVEEIDVEIGTAIETTTDFFVQGVWDGNYSDGDFANAHFSCCTGGCINANKKIGGVIFSTPNHLLEAIYGVITDNCIYLSNSLAFVLVKSDSELDPNYPDYQLDMCSSLFGIKRQRSISPLMRGKHINYFRGCNIKIDRLLNIEIENKDSGLYFSDFQSYYHIVKKILSNLFKNAEDAHRHIKYNSLSTISRGYDAVASSVLAHQLGCNKVMTFNSPKKYSSDNGEEIAKRIGFTNIYLCDANKYFDNIDYVEAECISSGDVGSSIIFAAHKDLFRNSMIMMGVRGDSLWERCHTNVNNNQDFTAGNTLQQTDHTFVETCLDVNAMWIPIPMIGADRWSDLARISNSEEMKTYSVRPNYDRPIPRRIAEEYGIPRDWFGLEKSGAGISYHFDTFRRILKKMSTHSAESLIHFKKQFNRSRKIHIKQQCIFYFNELPVYINYIFAKFHIGLKLRKRPTYVSSPLSSLLIHWSINQMMNRYKKR